MSATLEIRPLVNEDLEAVAAVARLCEPYGWTLKNFQDALASGYGLCVGLINGQIIGYWAVRVIFDEAELLEIGVAPQWQGQGFGKALLENALQWAKEHLARVVHLEVRESNVRARTMYTRHHFVEVGKRPNYYRTDDGRETAILMTYTEPT